MTTTTLTVMTWDEFEVLLAKSLPGFARREIQAALANNAMISWEAKNHILAQAGCGTGKSFVAAFVALMRALLTGQPVTIATATKALQDQYAEKDLPFLASILEGLRYVVLKGRANYVCMAKVNELEGSTRTSILAQTDAEGFSGEVIDLTGNVDPKLVVTSSEECPGKKDCPFGDICFAERAKEKAKTAHIVVANHAVVAADMSIKAMQEQIGVPADKVVGILPQVSGMIVDEAHEFENSVTNALGGEVTAGSYGRLARECGNWFNDRHVTDALTAEVDALFAVVSRALNNREDKRNKTLPISEIVLSQLAQPVENLTNELAKLVNKMKLVQIHGDDKKVQQRKRLVRRVENASQKLHNLVVADEESLVRWLELGEGQKGNSIAWAPLDVSDFLRENLWSKMPGMLMSATLALGNDFSYITEQLGLD